VSWRAEPGGPEAYSCRTSRAHGAMKKERHVCARRRVGEAAGPKGRARRPKACRNSGSASAAEAFMNKAGYEVSGGFGERNRDGHRGRVQRW
jgi:hypothetical protein